MRDLAASRRYLFVPQKSMPLLRSVMVEGLVAGAPCVTWVLDDRVVGDNISDRVSPTMVGARSRQCSKAVQHMLAGTPVAGADRETTRDV